MLSKIGRVPIEMFRGLGTDAKVSMATPFKQNLSTTHLPEGLRIKNPEFHVAELADFLISQHGFGVPLAMPFEGYWPNQMESQPKRTEAAYVCNECVKLYEPKHLIQVRDVVGSKYCVSSEKGQELSKSIKDILSKKKKINLSFAGVNNISSAFLDEAIGNLYNGNFKEEDLNKIYYQNLAKEDRFLLVNVIEWAKEGFRDSDE